MIENLKGEVRRCIAYLEQKSSLPASSQIAEAALNEKPAPWMSAGIWKDLNHECSYR